MESHPNLAPAAKRPRRRRGLLFAAASLLVSAPPLHFAAAVLRPAQTSYGSTWSAFLAEPEDSLDVIYLGSSFAYCDINPSIVYEHSGLTGYVMGGSEQPLSITYWYLREILRTQSPEAVVLEATSLYFKRYQNYTQTNIVPMPFSLNKLGAVFTAAEPELRLGLLFDLYFYHGRWQELGRADVKKALFPHQWDEKKGFTPMNEVLEGVGEAPYVADRQVSGEDYANNLFWLEKLIGLCREKGIRLILTVNPSYTRCTPEAYASLAEDVHAIEPSVEFYDWSAMFEEIGLVPTLHLYDGGHLNQDGAAVFSAWLGGFLTGELGLTPRAQTAENTAAWQSCVAWWEDYLAQ